MLLGSCYAGMAFANAPVAAVHALAYPLGARFKVAHGLSNALMLPHVLAFNAGEEEADRGVAQPRRRRPAGVPASPPRSLSSPLRAGVR